MCYARSSRHRLCRRRALCIPDLFGQLARISACARTPTQQCSAATCRNTRHLNPLTCPPATENLLISTAAGGVGKLKLCGNKPLSRAVVSASADGTYVAVVWPAAQAYCVLRQGLANWEE